MTFTIEIPDEFVAQIVLKGQEPARQALEDMAAEAHRVTGAQLRRLLGIPSRDELDRFLKEPGVWLEYTLDDFLREGQITAPLLATRQQEIH